jgi:hypothetical protein
MRNRPDIAVREVESSFEYNGVELDFPLLVAPQLEASEMVEVNHSPKAGVARKKSRLTTKS